MQISVIHPDELGGSEIDAWHAMQDHCQRLGNPFLCPEFAQAVGKHRQSARVAVIGQDGLLAGFFPFERHALGSGRPIGAGLTDCQGLVSAGDAQWDPAELLRACGLHSWHFDHLVDARQPFACGQVASAPSPVIDLSDGFAAYAERGRARSPKFWRDVGRKTRKMERELGPLKLVADSQDLRDLRMLMTWKSAQYRRTGRLDRFAHPWVVALVEQLLAGRRSRLRGVLSVLYAGGIPVAGSFDLLYDGTLAGWFAAYDCAYAQHSPGRIHLVKMAEEITALGVRSIDMGKGDKWYKEKLKSYDLSVGEGTVTARSLFAVAHRARYAPAAWAIRQVRANPRLFALADRVLKGYGRVHTALRPGRQSGPA